MSNTTDAVADGTGFSQALTLKIFGLNEPWKSTYMEKRNEIEAIPECANWAIPYFTKENFQKLQDLFGEIQEVKKSAAYVFCQKQKSLLKKITEREQKIAKCDEEFDSSAATKKCLKERNQRLEEKIDETYELIHLTLSATPVDKDERDRLGDILAVRLAAKARIRRDIDNVTRKLEELRERMEIIQLELSERRAALKKLRVDEIQRVNRDTALAIIEHLNMSVA
jgi:chromosome segregation ATPase